MSPQYRNWIAVASAAHVRIGRTQGFMQVCHGKAAPLRRIKPHDRVAYYSPTEEFGGRNPSQSLTACGTMRVGEPYQVEMAPGFRPFRRDVDWATSVETPIRPLLPRLEFGRKPNWGYQLRFGLFEISEADMDVIEAAMREDGRRPDLQSTSSTLVGPPPSMRCASEASMNWSRSPSSTSSGVPETTPVRRSFTI